jgi:hypothetical protein
VSKTLKLVVEITFTDEKEAIRFLEAAHANGFDRRVAIGIGSRIAAYAEPYDFNGMVGVEATWEGEIRRSDVSLITP